MEEWRKAWKDKQAGMKDKDIADKYGKSINTVKSWWKRHKDELQGAPQGKRKGAPPKKRGAPKGNRNAAGNNGGAPLGNKNREKHGIYTPVYFDALTDEEQKLFAEIAVDPLQLQRDQVKLYVLRVRRLMLLIQHYSAPEEKKAFTTTSITKTQALVDITDPQMMPKDWRYLSALYTEAEKADKIETLSMVVQSGKAVVPGYEATTTTVANIELIGKLEAELTKVQRQLSAAIVTLKDMEREAGGSESDQLVDDWVAAVLATMPGGDEGD